MQENDIYMNYRLLVLKCKVISYLRDRYYKTNSQNIYPSETQKTKEENRHIKYHRHKKETTQRGLLR